MKSINKKLYAVILACLLLLSFSIVAIAEEGTPSNSGNNSSTSNTISAPADTSDTNGSNSTGSGDTSNTTPSDIYSSDTEISSTGNGTESYDVSSLADNSSNTNTSKISTSSKSSSSKKQTYSSKKQTTTDNNDYQKPSGYGNVGGTVDDGIDTSGWGTEDASSELQSAGTTEKTGSKQITDYSTLLWILIWIPILLIIASVAALVYVNRKEFLNGEKEDLSDNGDKTSSKKKTKRKTVSKSKASHKKRTNVYKPRD